MASTEKAQEILEQLAAGVEALVTGADWHRALDVIGRFHSYSFGNCLLIGMQNPDATRVAGFNTWKGLGRSVRKGERGIRILAPMVGKKTVEDKDGNEEKQAFVKGFRSVAVFDVSQTEGEDLKLSILHPADLEGDAPENMLSAIASLVRAAGFDYERGTVPIAGAKGVTIWDSRRVIVDATLSDAMAAKTSLHELAHVLLHEKVENRTCRGVVEVEAESAAYVAAVALGLDTSDYSFAYVGGWSDGKPEQVQAVGARVVKAANAMIDGVEKFEKEEAA